MAFETKDFTSAMKTPITFNAVIPGLTLCEVSSDNKVHNHSWYRTPDVRTKGSRGHHILGKSQRNEGRGGPGGLQGHAQTNTTEQNFFFFFYAISRDPRDA